MGRMLRLVKHEPDLSIYIFSTQLKPKPNFQLDQSTRAETQLCIVQPNPIPWNPNLTYYKSNSKISKVIQKLENFLNSQKNFALAPEIGKTLISEAPESTKPPPFKSQFSPS